MSRCYKDAETCACCGTSYKAFRTGFSWQDIVTMLRSPDEDPRTWRYRRRNTILGVWHQTKKELWAQHCAECVIYETDDSRLLDGVLAGSSDTRGCCDYDLDAVVPF